MFYIQIIIARGFLSLLRSECTISVFAAIPPWLLPTQPLVISRISPVHPCSRCYEDPGFMFCCLEKSCPKSFLGSQLLKTSLQIPQNFICKKTRRSFALIELDLTCCCLYQLLWKENQVEIESGAWQVFPSSPRFSSNFNDFLSVGSVHVSCMWICMPLLIAEQINLLQTICCCYNVCKYVISHCKKKNKSTVGLIIAKRLNADV